MKRNGNVACGTTSQSSLRDASSPGRGALGRPGQPCCSRGPNRAQGGGPCSRWQWLRDCALPKGAGQAAANRGSEARSFLEVKNFARSAQPPPTRQWLPYQGSCRAVGETERLYEESPSGNCEAERKCGMGGTLSVSACALPPLPKGEVCHGPQYKSSPFGGAGRPARVCLRGFTTGIPTWRNTAAGCWSARGQA